MPKSEIKKFLMGILKENKGDFSAIYNGNDAELLAKRNTVRILDGSVSVRRVGHSVAYTNQAISLRTFVSDFLLRDVLDAARSSSCKCVFFGVDKPQYVTEAKRACHTTRDVSVDEEAALAAIPSDGFTLDMNIQGVDYGAIINCRKTRSMFLEFIFQHLSELLPITHITSDTMVVFDFSHEIAPAVFHLHEGKFVCDEENIDFINTIGEGDLIAPFVIKTLRLNYAHVIGTNPTFLIDSIDADLLHILLLYAVEEDKLETCDLHLLLRGCGKIGRNGDFIFNIKKVANQLLHVFPGTNVRECVHNLARCVTISGGDFSQGIPGVGLNTVMKVAMGKKREWPPEQDVVDNIVRASKRHRKLASPVAEEIDRVAAQTEFSIAYWKSASSANPKLPYVDPFHAQGTGRPAFKRTHDGQVEFN